MQETVLITLSLLNASTGPVLFYIPPDQYWAMLAVNVIGSILAGPTAPIVWAMYGDVADYSEWKHNRRMTGLVFSASMLAQKFGLTIGAGLSGWLLGLFGYVANMPQTEQSLRDRLPVTDDKPFKAPLLPQHLAKQPGTGRRRDTI